MIVYPKKVKQERGCNFSRPATLVNKFFQYLWKLIKTDFLNLYDPYDWKELKCDFGLVSDSFR